MNSRPPHVDWDGLTGGEANAMPFMSCRPLVIVHRRGPRMKRTLMSAILATLAASAACADALPSFPMFTSYQSARQNLLRQGWLPWRLPNASTCSPGDNRCRGRPEMLSCEASGSATCIFTWKRGNSIIEVTTRGKESGLGVTGVKCQSGCGSP